jgi:hypothetical protein
LELYSCDLKAANLDLAFSTSEISRSCLLQYPAKVGHNSIPLMVILHHPKTFGLAIGMVLPGSGVGGV